MSGDPRGDEPSGRSTDGQSERHGDRRDGWRLLRACLAEQRRGLALGVFVGLLWTAAKLCVPLLVGAAIDAAVEGSGSLLAWTAAIVALGLVAGCASGWRRYLAFREARLTERSLRERLFAHLQRLHIGFHDTAQTGQLMSRANNDLQQVNFFVAMLPIALSGLVMAVGAAAVLLVLNPLLAVCALAPLPAVQMLGRRFSQRIHPAVRAVQVQAAEMAVVVEESVSGVRVVKGFGAEEVQADRFDVEADDVYDPLDGGRAGVRGRFWPILELLPTSG